MRKFAIVLLMLALAIAAFFGGMQWNGRKAAGGAPTSVDAEASPDATTERPAEPSPGAAVAPADAAIASKTPDAPEPWPALPPPDASVADHYEELAERARRGDGNAACRLAVDLQRCGQVLAQRELAANLQDQAARRAETPAGLVDYLASLEQRQQRIGTRCDGLQPAQIDSAYEFQRQAAMARPELRPWFALNPALERRNFVNDLERWADYRRLAMPWLEAAAREGDIDALIAMARVHGDLRRNSPPFPPFRIPDDVRTVAYSDLLRRYGVEFDGIEIGARQALARLDADAQARATQLADSLFLPDRRRPSESAQRAMMQRTLEPFPASMECEATATR